MHCARWYLATEMKKNWRYSTKLRINTFGRACIGIISAEKEKATKGVLIDAPLLVEARLDKICDLVIGVLCDTERRIARIMARDGISEADARIRIAAQKSAQFYCRHCDALFWNDGTLDAAAAFAKDIDHILCRGGTI